MTLEEKALKIISDLKQDDHVVSFSLVVYDHTDDHAIVTFDCKDKKLLLDMLKAALSAIFTK